MELCGVKMSSISFALALLSVCGLIYEQECLEMKTLSKVSACSKTADETLMFQSCFEKRACRSLLECCALCNLNPTCLGVMKNGTRDFYFHKACSYLEYTGTCNGTLLHIHKMYTPVSCGIGSEFVPLTNKCECKLGWSGASCDTAPKDCSTLLTLSLSVGTYWIDTVSGGSIKPIFCELLSSSSFRLYVFKNDGRSDHNKTWSEFVSGYKIDNNNFWLGLDAMNSYANSGGKKLLMFGNFQNNVVTTYWTNSGVTVKNATYKYQITFTGSSSSGKAQSPFSVAVTGCLLSGVSFSTWDSDNEGNGLYNLASAAGAGWFFGDSLDCNPLGRLRSTLPLGQTDGQIILPSLDMVKGGFESYFNYVAMCFE